MPSMRAAPLPPGLLLTRTEWVERGVSSRRVSGPELTRVLGRWYTPTSAPASLDRIAAVLQTSVLPHAVISHTTAAAFHGIPLPWWVDDGISFLAEPDARGRYPAPIPSRRATNAGPGNTAKTGVTDRPVGTDRSDGTAGTGSAGDEVFRPPRIHCRVPGPSRRGAGPAVTVHRMRPACSMLVRGIAVSHPVVALVECAGILDLDDLVVGLDHLLGPRSRYADGSRQQIAKILDSLDGSHGVRLLRRALELARPGVESPGETRTRLLVTCAGFPEPVPNLPVKDPDSGVIRRLDNGRPEQMVGAEYDGDYHRRGRDKDRRGIRQWRRDHARRESLTSLGWTLPFLDADDIADPRRFLSTLRRAFVSHGAEAPPESRWLGEAGDDLCRVSVPPRRWSAA